MRALRPGRRRWRIAWLAIGWAGVACAGPASAASDPVDPRLAAEIARIRVIDDHTHADPATAERGRLWSDAAPLGAPEYPDVAPLRRDGAGWIPAWRALYGYRYRDLLPGHLRALLAAKRRLMREKGSAWPEYVLDRSGVDVAFVNATHLGAGQRSPRFRWVPWADPLLWPFGADAGPIDFPGGPSSIAQLEREAGVAAPPASLDGYLAEVVEPTLARWSAAGVPAIKFLCAYYRSLDFAAVDGALAARLYAAASSGQAVSADDRKALEDYLFREIAARAGARGLVVQIHTGNGNGPYFNNSRANPGLLEDALGAPALQHTRFVLLHGGWPFPLIAQAMTDKPNVYADFSAQTFYLTTHALAQALRGWLEWHPEKLLFGSDAYSDPNTPLSDFEEKQWLLTEKARRALALALTAMQRDGEISQARAVELARLVLRDNARALYRLGD